MLKENVKVKLQVSVVLDFIQQLGDMFIKLGQYTKPLLLTNIYF